VSDSGKAREEAVGSDRGEGEMRGMSDGEIGRMRLSRSYVLFDFSRTGVH
jgi:hypothetical protein